MFEIKKEKQYGIAARGYIYRVFFEGEEIAASKDKESAIAAAKAELLDAWKCRSNQPIVSVAVDGTPISTREYGCKQIETVFHRPDQSGGCGVGGCAIDGKTVSVREYHEHFVAQYNSAVTPLLH